MNKVSQSMNLKGIDKGVKPAAKRCFLNNIGLFLTAREKILNNFKSDKVPTPAQAPAPASVPAPTPQQHRNQHLSQD